LPAQRLATVSLKKVKTMNENQLQLVTFEQAKRLKNFGFDWECNAKYEYELITDNIDLFNYNSQFWTYSAPTVALALKWFRDVHVEKISILIDKLFNYSGEYFDGKDEWIGTVSFKIYEEAESALLDELLTTYEN